MSDVEGKKKILHIIDSFGAGGAETWLLSAVKYINEHPEIGLEFHFLATGGEKNVYDDEVIRNGAEIFYFKYSFKNLFRFRKFLKKLFSDNNYFAIHDHQDFVSGWHFLCCRGFLPNVRISHLHNPYNFVQNYVVNPGRWISFRLGRLLTAWLATGITGTSDAVMDEYGYDRWPYSKKRIAPAYCGFEAEKFEFDVEARTRIRCELGFTESGLKVCLFVGRIGLLPHDTARNQKNPEFAIAVAKKMIEGDDNWRFLFVGFKGVYGEKVDKEIERSKLAGKIRFLGLRADVDKILSASDVLVFPSFWEGLGMVAVEAQASGLPVVMSNTIPREAVICNDIVFIRDLNEEAWVKCIRELSELTFNRIEYVKRVKDSQFSIENSVRYLSVIYN
jgi:glycosyltransferase involved in cell wall biosynthesis